MEKQEHLGIGVHEDEWLSGTPGTCPLCLAAYDQNMARHAAGKKVTFNIQRLRADNAGHYTQAELARDIVDQAKKDGREIERARR